ncbi:MAG TPA: tetratricopeptide repeat protein [Polyangiaceae bacterium]
MSDPLLEAARALREHVNGETQSLGRSTRARVLLTVRLQQRRRIIKLTFGIPLAAILVGSGAWAASQPTLQYWVQRVANTCGLHVPASALEARAVKPVTHRGSGVASTVPVLSSIPGDDTATVLPPEPLQHASPPDHAKSSASTAAISPRPMTSIERDTLMTQRDLDAYEAAHRLHFSGNDPKAALAAWNEYLIRMPRGRFAVEAKYNRAMCLIRLGRNSEALQALRPFAHGSMGNYRRAEAKSLCEQLAQTSSAAASAHE